MEAGAFDDGDLFLPLPLLIGILLRRRPSLALELSEECNVVPLTGLDRIEAVLRLRDPFGSAAFGASVLVVDVKMFAGRHLRCG